MPKIKLYFQDVCEGCDNTKCQECCEHLEHEHFICIDCGYALDAGLYIDRAMDRACED